MIVSAPVAFLTGTALQASGLCQVIYHSGNNPDVVGGKGAGEVLQGHVELANLASATLTRSQVRRRSFHELPRVSSTAVNLDFLEDLFTDVEVYDVCDDPQFLPAAVPIPGAVKTWTNRRDFNALEVRIGLVVAVGTDDPKPDWSNPDLTGTPSSGYTNLGGAWKEVTWAGLFFGSGTAAQFAQGYDTFFPLGQTQTRVSNSAGAGDHTATVKSYTDVRAWTDRIVIDQAWLTANVSGLTAANNPLTRGERTMGLRLASEELVSRVKRAYISVTPIR